MDLKRAMLLRLARKDTQLYPNDPVQREKVYNKYKVVRMSLLRDATFAGNIVMNFFLTFFRFLLSKQQFGIPEEEAEWVGLSLEEAVEKQRQLEHKVTNSLNATPQDNLPHT